MSGALPALLLTLAIELPIVVALYPGQRLRMGLVGLTANVVTNLGLNLVLLPISGRLVLLGEAFALVSEAFVYWLASRPRSLPRAVLVSGLANSLSWVGGLLLLR